MVKMNKQQRKEIIEKIKYEIEFMNLRHHIFQTSYCKRCGKWLVSERNSKCWECLLED